MENFLLKRITFSKEGVNRGMEIRRSVLFFWPKFADPLLFSFKSGSPLHKVILWYMFIAIKDRFLFFPLDALGEINVGVAVNL